MSQYAEQNKQTIADYKKQYREDNKDRLNEQFYISLKTNIQTRLKHSLRNRLNRALQGAYKSGSAVKDLGCSIECLKQYLESLFIPGMTWDNWTTNGWHIDHIIPLDYFDLTDRQQFLRATHYTNLQPLWASENSKKKNRIVTQECLASV